MKITKAENKKRFTFDDIQEQGYFIPSKRPDEIFLKKYINNVGCDEWNCVELNTGTSFHFDKDTPVHPIEIVKIIYKDKFIG